MYKVYRMSYDTQLYKHYNGISCVDKNVLRIDPRDNNREKKCGSISERVTPCNVRHVKAAKSPVVCQGKLTGFVGDSANNPYKMKFKHIKHELEDIKKVLKLDCCR